MKHLLFALIFFAAPLLAEQFSVQPHGLLGPKRTFVDAWFFNEGGGTVTKGIYSAGDLLSGPTWITELHSYGLNFSATNSRVEIRNESNFDFMTLTNTWMIIFVYEASRLLAGIIFSKTGTFSSPQGFYLQAESDATGDLAFNRILGGAPAKWVTPVIPVSKAAGKKKHVLIFSYSYNANLPINNYVKFFLDGENIPVTGAPSIGDITNDNLVVISGWDDGTSSSFVGNLDMVGVWRDTSANPSHITEGEARAITARILGR